MVTREPLLNALVAYLAESRDQILENPDAHHKLVFSRANLNEVRAAFSRMICRGESRLHRLCRLLADTLFDHAYALQGVVIGELPATGDRFTLSKPLRERDLYVFTDLDLGNRLLADMRYRHGHDWTQPTLVANFVEYQPRAKGLSGVHKMISRIKAEEEIWNKVVDEIFDLDELIQRDKQLQRLSRYVKDVFGVKIVVGSEEEAQKLHAQLETIVFAANQLAEAEVPFLERTRTLRFIEVKNYLTNGRKKGSGWEAMKSVVEWFDKCFEIQIQPLPNYFLEREYLTRESHAAFKERRERVRDQIAERLPLVGFYRETLRFLFRSPDGPPPRLDNVEIELGP